MWPRLWTLLLCLPVLACADDASSAPDSGLPAAGMDAATELAADAPPADAPPDGPPDALTSASTPCTTPRPGDRCTDGEEWGCCGDNTAIPRICEKGAWVCPPHTTDPNKCCGIVINGSCGPFNLAPQCNFLFPDGGLGNRGQ